MTKEKLISLIKDKLSGGDYSEDIRSKFHPSVIEQYVSLAFNDLAYEAFSRAKRHTDLSQLSTFTKSYNNVEVLYDTDRDEHYSLLPVSLIHLPENTSVRSISPMKDQSFQFVYRDNNASFIYSNLEVNDSDVPRYYIESNRIYYVNLPQDINKVLMKLIPPFSELEDTDFVPMPAGKDIQIVELVFSMMINKPKEDLINDSV